MARLREERQGDDTADASGLRVHDLLHGFVSLAAQEFPAHRLQALAGHADPRTTARYTYAKARPDDLDCLTRAFHPGDGG